ncbi:MAG: hypothetical protein Q9218_004992 [Villophora microphyllina]
MACLTMLSPAYQNPLPTEEAEQSKRKRDAGPGQQAQKRTKIMGRPRILTDSQERKLVRLYLFTSLEVDSIGKLLGFRHKTPGKRTVRKILREILKTGYHLYRPKDKETRKNRLLQVAFYRSKEQSRSGDTSRTDAPSPVEQHDELDAETANPDAGHDWIDLVHWDEDYIGQGMEDLLKDAERFVEHGKLDHDELMADITDLQTIFESPAPCTGPPQLSLRDVDDQRMDKTPDLRPDADSEHPVLGPGILDLVERLPLPPQDPGHSEQLQPTAECLEIFSSMTGMDRFGNTLLHLAAHLDANLTLLVALIAQFDIGKVNCRGETFLHLLKPHKLGDDLPHLIQMLECRKFPFAQRDYLGRTSIHALLERGAKIELLASHFHLLSCKECHRFHAIGSRPVRKTEEAIAHGYFELEPLWQDLWQDLWHDEFCRSCEVYGCACPKNQVFEVEHYGCAGETSLIRAVRNNDENMNQAYYADLVARGADIHQRNWRMETPLSVAVQYGNVKATSAFLEYGANVHVTDTRGIGILECARRAKDLNPGLYAGITLCEALVIDAGAVREPTIFDEWEMKMKDNG